MQYRRQAHSVYYTRYHVVFGTRYRRKILKAGMGAWLRYQCLAVTRHHPEIQVVEVNTDEDHIHLLLSIAPKMSISHAVNLMKSNTAAAMRKKFSYLDRVYHDGHGGIWATGYFVSTVGVNEEIIQRYIEQQGREDSGQATLELQ